MSIFAYPMDTVPISYRTGAGVYGAKRDGGRQHAGCDLYAKAGTPVYAVKSGIVTAISTDFMSGNPPDIGAVTIDHGIMICRYAEIKPQVKKGEQVKAGQQIGAVQKLVFRSGFTTSMLHFELFSGFGSGPLSNSKNPPFKRRKDLLNPTLLLTILEMLAKKKK